MMVWAQRAEEGLGSRSKKSLTSSVIHRGNDPGHFLQISRRQKISEVLWFGFLDQHSYDKALGTRMRKGTVRKGKDVNQHRVLWPNAPVGK